MRQPLKFHYKIYLMSGLIILLIVLPNLVSQHYQQRIVGNIATLSGYNRFLQHTLAKLAEVERLERLTTSYTYTADNTLLLPIDHLFQQVMQQQPTLGVLNREFSASYQLLLENIHKYRQSFELAQRQVPRSFALREQLRAQGLLLEAQLDRLQPKGDSSLALLRLRKAFLEAEKGVVRYTETPDVSFVRYSRQALDNVSQILQKLQQEAVFAKEDLDQLGELVAHFKQLVNQTIEHYRTYSMLIRVVMPGDAYEIRFYGHQLRVLTLREAKSIESRLQALLQLNRQIDLFSSLSASMLVVLAILLLLRMIFYPLRELTHMFERLAASDTNVHIPHSQTDDAIGRLIRSAYHYREVNQQTRELLKITEDYKSNLELRVQQEIEKRREREKALIQQSKLAAMGEMIGAIAHQWRQPLNELAIRIQKLKYSFMRQQMDEKFIDDFIDKNKATIDFMSHTIDDFRNFFRIDKEKKAFSVAGAIAQVVDIQSAQLKNHNISLQLEGDDFVLDGYRSEFQQVIINLISNAKDAVVQQQTEQALIHIEIQSGAISFRDNAGGVDEGVLERLFEPYFTTKPQGEGTGMGLYMAKMIIEENMDGSISAENCDQGLAINIHFKDVEHAA